MKAKRFLSIFLAALLVTAMVPFALATTVSAVDSRESVGTTDMPDLGYVNSYYAYVASTGDDTAGSVYTAAEASPANLYATVNAAGAALSATGGYIVITDVVEQGGTISFAEHDKYICYTSDDGVTDYGDSGAMLYFTNSGYRFCAYGPTYVRDLNIKVTSTVVIAAQFHPFVIGNTDVTDADDVNFYNADGNKIVREDATVGSGEVAVANGTNCAWLIGGYQSSTNTYNGNNLESTLVVRSGVYNNIIAANRTVSTGWLGLGTIYMMGNASTRVIYGTYGISSAGGSTFGSMRLIMADNASVTTLVYMGGSNTSYVARGCCYCVLKGGTVKAFNTTIGAIHSSANNKDDYDVLVYDGNVFSSLPAGASTIFDYKIDYTQNTTLTDADETNNTVHLKTNATTQATKYSGTSPALIGNGSGADSDNACPDLTTAYLLLGFSGGTIKLCGDVTFTSPSGTTIFQNTGIAASSGVRHFVEPYHSGLVTITSADTDNANSVTVPGSFRWICSGDTTFGTFNQLGAAASSFLLTARFNDFTASSGFTIAADCTDYTVIGGVQQYCEGMFCLPDYSAEITMADNNTHRFFGGFGRAITGRTFTGTITVNLTAGSWEIVISNITSDSTCVGGNVIINTNSGVTITALNAAGYTTGVLGGDFTLNYGGGTITSLYAGPVANVNGTAAFNDLTVSGDGSMRNIARNAGFDAITGYEPMAFTSPVTDLSDEAGNGTVSTIWKDGKVYLDAAHARYAVKNTATSGKYTLLVPNETRSYSIQIEDTAGNTYAYLINNAGTADDGTDVTVVHAEGLDTLFKTTGVAIRTAAFTKDSVTYDQGLRYTGQILTSARSLTVEDDGYAVTEYGILAKFNSTTNEIIYENAGVADGAMVGKSVCYSTADSIDKTNTSASTDTRTGFRAALTGFDATEYTSDVKFRCYAVIKDGTNTYYVYGGLVQKNIKAVAAGLYCEDAAADPLVTNAAFAALSADEQTYVSTVLGIS